MWRTVLAIVAVVYLYEIAAAAIVSNLIGGVDSSLWASIAAALGR